MIEGKFYTKKFIWYNKYTLIVGIGEQDWFSERCFTKQEDPGIEMVKQLLIDDLMKAIRKEITIQPSDSTFAPDDFRD